MADPITLAAAIGVGSTLAAGGIKAYGDILGGNAQSQMYQYQAGIARMNSQIAQQNANYAMQKGEVEALKSGMKTGQEIGQIKATQAASGLDVNRGSAVAVRTSQQAVGDYNEALIRSKAAREAYGFRVGGLMDQEQARMDEFAAKNAKTASYLSAAGSILGAAGSVSGKWMTGQSVGLSGQGGEMTTDTSGASWG